MMQLGWGDVQLLCFIVLSMRKHLMAYEVMDTFQLSQARNGGLMIKRLFV